MRKGSFVIASDLAMVGDSGGQPNVVTGSKVGLVRRHVTG